MASHFCFARDGTLVSLTSCTYRLQVPIWLKLEQRFYDEISMHEAAYGLFRNHIATAASKSNDISSYEYDFQAHDKLPSYQKQRSNCDRPFCSILWHMKTSFFRLIRRFLKIDDKKMQLGIHYHYAIDWLLSVNINNWYSRYGSQSCSTMAFQCSSIKSITIISCYDATLDCSRSSLQSLKSIC